MSEYGSEYTPASPETAQPEAQRYRDHASEVFVICNECGSAVVDRIVHDRFHGRLKMSALGMGALFG